jgi:diguanylate cyclase (GGDEF)-like protein
VDRYRPPVGPPAKEAHPALDPAATAAGLAMVAVAPASVALLRLFPPLLPSEHGVGWLLPAASGVASLAVALCMMAALAGGLRRGVEKTVVRAAGIGLFAVGLGVASLRAVSAEGAAAFPDGGLAAAAVAGGAMLLLAQFSRRRSHGRDRSRLAILLLFGALELGLAASLLLIPPDGTWPWLLGIAAALVAASAVPGPWLAAGLVTAGLAALAAARPGSVDSVPGLVAVAAGSIAYARSATGAPPQVADVAEPEVPSEAPGVDPAVAAAAVEDASRLARELRGTIEELLHARRTIELQREEIAQVAAVDTLTGVATRRAILERLRIEAAEARRYQHPFAAVLLDLDGFTQLNHERGMSTADAVLREVALRLRLRVRAADALGRVGADSFLAILPHTDETGAATFADALRRLLTGRPIETEDGELAIGVSIGVAFMRAGAGLSDEELLASADEALASARAAGGNRIAFDRAHGLVRLEERSRPSVGPRADGPRVDEGAV